MIPFSRFRLSFSLLPRSTPFLPLLPLFEPSPFLVFSVLPSPFLPRSLPVSNSFSTKSINYARELWRNDTRDLVRLSLSTPRHPSKRKRGRGEREKEGAATTTRITLARAFFTSVIGRPYVSREVCACYVITLEEGNIEQRKPITFTLGVLFLALFLALGNRVLDLVYDITMRTNE